MIGEGDVLSFGKVIKGIGDLPDEFQDIALAGMEAQLTLLHFPEVEELVDEVEEAAGVAADHFVLVARVRGEGWRLARFRGVGSGELQMRDVGAGEEFLDGGQDQGEGGTQFVAHVGEEPDLHQVDFVKAFCLAAFLFEGKAHPGFSDDHPAGNKENTDQRQEVDDISQGCLPERGKDDDLQGGLAVIPLAVLVGGFYLKGIGAGIEVGIGGFACVAVGDEPVRVESFEGVGVFVAGVVNKVECGEFDGKDVLAMGQGDLRGFGDGAVEDDMVTYLLADMDGLVEDVQTGQDYRRRGGGVGDVVRPEQVESVRAAEQKAAIAGVEGGAFVELPALEPIFLMVVAASDADRAGWSPVVIRIRERPLAVLTQRSWLRSSAMPRMVLSGRPLSVLKDWKLFFSGRKRFRPSRVATHMLFRLSRKRRMTLSVLSWLLSEE